MTDEKRVELPSATWRVVSDDDRLTHVSDRDGRLTYAHERDGRRTTVTVTDQVIADQHVDIVGPHVDEARELLDATDVDREAASVRLWDRVETERGTWLAAHDGGRRVFRYNAGVIDEPTVGTAALDDDGEVERLAVTGPEPQPVLDAFDQLRAEEWHVTGVDDPGSRAATLAGRAAEVLWNLDRPGVTAQLSVDPDGRATRLLLDGPDPARVDPEGARRANIGPIRHVGAIDTDRAVELVPAVAEMDRTEDGIETAAVSRAYLRTGERGIEGLLREADHVADLLDDDSEMATALAETVETLRPENIAALATSDGFRRALSDEARAVATETTAIDVIAGGPNLDAVLETCGADRADVWHAWHVDGPAERTAAAVDAAADLTVWAEDTETQVRRDSGERRRVTRCARSDDTQDVAIHVDEAGRETLGYVRYGDDGHTECPVVAGPNDELVTDALDIEPGVRVLEDSGQDLRGMVREWASSNGESRESSGVSR